MSNFLVYPFQKLAYETGYDIISTRVVQYEDTRRDMAFILRPSDDPMQPWMERTNMALPMLNKGYRQGLPKELANQKLNYHVPYIDHYNYGLRFNRWQMVKHNEGIGFEECE